MNFLSTFRYVVFAFFIVCNAILASVAVWNSSLLALFGRDSRIDIVIIVVGALGLALTFTIIFVELVRRNAFTSRVWFEVLWTTLFFVLYLGSASVLTAVGLVDLCSQHSGKTSTCASTRVLMGFTWLCAFILLIYLVLLIVLTVAHRNNEAIPRIWECTVHNFPPLTAPRSHVHTPAPPIVPRFSRNQMTQIAAPIPQRPAAAPPALYSHRSIGLNSQYQIEHFTPPEQLAETAEPSAANPVSSPADYLHRNPSAEGTIQAAVALYPRFISSAYVSTSPAVSPRQSLQPANRSPPPLGDWPRADAPLRVKRKLPPTAGLDGGAERGVSPTRPLGPRIRTGGTQTRPPPLDLNRRRDGEQQNQP